MEILKVTDYDVLADETPGEGYLLDDYKKHIGNTRFSVLVDMYREAYDMNSIRGNESECTKIVDRIVGVTCHKDVSIAMNKGRFLAKYNGEGNWQALDDKKSADVARQALSTPASIPEEPVEAESIPSAGFSSMAISGMGNDKKRGRRRSLLRRSASESTMMEDKKKTYRALAGLDAGEGSSDNIEQPTFRRIHATAVRPTCPSSIRKESGSLTRHVSAPVISTSISAPMPSTPNKGTITSHTGMDVVVARNGRMLSTNGTIVGNNRLQVMLTLQERRFKDLGPADQDKVAADLVKAVVQYWGGRILIEQEVSYRKLDSEESLNVVKMLLSQDDIASPLPVSSNSKPLLNAPPVPAFLREASMELMGNGSSKDPVDMQSAAVKSLQQRKAKRTITKSLGQGRAVPDSFPEI